MSEARRLVTALILLSVIAALSLPVAAQATGQNTILQNLAGNSDFSTLANAAKATGLDSTLNGAAPYTLFAPNNAAFGKIPQQSLTALQKDNPKMADLLKYHVVPGKLSTTDLAGRTSVTTIDGRTLPVARQADGTITVGGAKVLNQGIDSSNGIIYPVDTVMMPPGFVMPQAAQAPAQAIPWGLLLLGAIILGGLALALYLLTRPKKHAEPRARYEERPAAEWAPPYEERVRTEETRRPEETMREVRESVSAYREPQIADIVKNLDLPLSGMALTGLNALIDKGTFSDRQDFIGYLAKTFMANKVGDAMSEGKEPTESMIMDIIDRTGIAKGFSSDDTRRMLVPLLITGFTAIYNYLRKRPAVKAT